MGLRRAVLLIVFAGAALLAASAASASAACPERLRCLSVTVPLDRSGAVPGTLELPVVVSRGDGPILVSLGGGPGQGMVQYAEDVGVLLRRVLPRRHRFAVLDQRGTGPAGLDCPALQRAHLTDLTVPPRGAVERCGTRIGAARGFYTTTETVADLEAVRMALGVEQLGLMGVSYGTYVAQRYARAFPDRVSRLVLDSVVPQENVDPFFAASMRRAGVVLRQLCRTEPSACRGVTRDPAADLARLVRRANRTPIRGRVPVGPGVRREPVSVDGPALLDLMTTLASFEPLGLAQFPRAARSALRGLPAPLLSLTRAVQELSATRRLADLSWGLHTATLCADVAWPWGGPAADPAGRRPAAETAAGALPASHFAPFDRATATGNGALVTCERWPVTDVAPPPPAGDLPAVPTLLLAGAWDLSTPVDDARRAAARSSTARLVVVPQGGHAVSSTAPCTLPVLRRFFAARPLGAPCARHRAI